MAFFIVTPVKNSNLTNDNLSNVRNEASTHLICKKREYLKDKMNELIIHSKNIKI
jgi:hypothetical protein